MVVSIYQIDDSLQLLSVSVDHAKRAASEGDVTLWTDLETANAGKFEEWLHSLGASELIQRLCLEAHDRSGFYPLKQEIFLVIPVLANTDDPEKVVFLAFLCQESRLFTMHDKSISSLKQLVALQGSDAWLPDRSVAGLMSAILIDLSQEVLHQTAKLRRTISVLEHRMDREPETVEADEIQEVRSDLLALSAIASDQILSVKALSVTERPFFKGVNAKEYLNCALANLQAADASLGWLNQRLDALRAGFQMHAQDKTNRRLNMLTVLSALFMPSTLLAGIWGMNFEFMPELGFSLGYPVALGLMALLAWGMFRYFRRHGWLD